MVSHDPNLDVSIWLEYAFDTVFTNKFYRYLGAAIFWSIFEMIYEHHIARLAYSTLFYGITITIGGIAFKNGFDQFDWACRLRHDDAGLSLIYWNKYALCDKSVQPRETEASRTRAQPPSTKYRLGYWLCLSLSFPFIFFFFLKWVLKNKSLKPRHLSSLL